MQIRLRISAVVMLPVLVAACGGSSSPDGSAVSTGLPNLPQFAQPPASAPVNKGGEIAVGGYRLLGSQPVSGTVFADTYAAEVSNWGTVDATIEATLGTTAAGITVVDGNVSFGEVPRGATRAGADTFTIRRDHNQPFDPAMLVWTVQVTALPPTTFELIDQARTNGAIDADTALLYKVYFEFNDNRLPAQYRGRNDGFFEARAVDAARRRFASLSPAVQTALAPFLRAPFEPGSWTELPSIAPRPDGDDTAGLGILDALVPSAAAADPSVRSVVVTVGGQDKARISWPVINSRQAARDEARAKSLKKELEDYLWVKLTGTFGEPLRDDKIPQRDGSLVDNPDPFGPDGLFDIILHPYILRARTSPRWEPCNGSPRAGVVVLTTESDAIELAHELMHAIALSYPLASCIDDYHWMDEAIATWAMQFTYPGPSPADVEHRSAPAFLGRPEERLNLDEETGLHQYGAYLWFFNLSGETNNPAPVKATWEAAASRDSIEAIDSVGGGFEANWGTFLANNWNRVAGDGVPHRDYYEWDEMPHQALENHRGVQKISLPVFGGVHLPIYHDLLPLAAQYEHFQFPPDDKIQQIWFSNDYAGAEPRARVHAIVKIRNEGWQRAVDWSNDRRHFFCRYNPKEDLEELVLVISNLDPANAQDFRPEVPRLGGDDTTIESKYTLDVSALPCHDFVGTVDFETTDKSDDGSTITTTAHATNVRFQLDLLSTEAQRGAVNYYKVVGGDVDWHIREAGGNCADRNAFGHFAPEGRLVISLGGPSLFYAIHNESAGSTEMVTVTCEGGPTDFQFSFSDWISLPQAQPLADAAAGLTGNQEFYPGNRDGWRWAFAKAAPQAPPTAAPAQ